MINVKKRSLRRVFALAFAVLFCLAQGTVLPLSCEALPTMSGVFWNPSAADSLVRDVDTESDYLTPDDLDGLQLIPGGMPFGVRFLTEGVTIVGFSDVETKSGKVNPASSAGLKEKDVILEADGTPLTSAKDLTERIENGKGKAITLTCRRGKNLLTVILTPVFSEKENGYKTGVWVRDSGAGIGTVTFILPDTGAFAGLGHGICDAETGALVPITKGSVSDVTVSSVVKGEVGKPGEIKGYFDPGKTGALLGNSDCGVYGIFSDTPEQMMEPMNIGLRDELEEGEATVYCTLTSNEIRAYTVKISDIKRGETGPKCFTVTVTDPALLKQTGGIVQGMSGSPIVQNGKLVGAVTHVLVNKPTTGYGIFIENMLLKLPLLVR